MQEWYVLYEYGEFSKKRTQILVSILENWIWSG